MLSKTVKSEISTEDNQIEQKTIKKRIKLPVRLNLE
jgi:hypothetical protein